MHLRDSMGIRAEWILTFAIVMVVIHAVFNTLSIRRDAERISTLETRVQELEANQETLIGALDKVVLILEDR